MSADNLDCDNLRADSPQLAGRDPTAGADHANRVSVAGLFVFYAAYVLAGSLGQGLSLIPGVAIIFWPPAGVFVGTLLMNARRTWPWWIAAGCAAELTCNALWFHNSVPFSLLYFGANALTACTAALLVERFGYRPLRLATLKEVSVLTFLAAGIAPLASATIIATIDAMIGKHPFTTAWLLVWIGDGTGLLVSTPLTLVAIDAWRNRQHVSRRGLAESVSMHLLMIIVGFLAMRGYLPTVYLLMPIVLWIATRFLIRGIAVALPVVTIMTAAFTAMGTGEFTGSAEVMQAKILSLQVFLGVCSVSALLVAAVSSERQQAIATLNSIKAELEQSVEKRTIELEQSYRELQARNKQLGCLSQVSQTLIAESVLEQELLAAVFTMVAESIGAEVYVSYQPHDDTSMRLCNWTGLSESERLELATVSYGEMLCGRVAAGGLPVIIEDLACCEMPGSEAARAAGFRAYAGFPLVADDQLLGTIAFLTRSKTHFAEGEVAMIQAACDQLSATLQRMRLTADLLKSEERLRLAIEATGVGIFDFDPQSQRQSFSAEALRLWGLDPGIEPTPELLLCDIHPEDRARAGAITVGSLDPMGSGQFALEHRLVRPDGSVRWISTMGRTQFVGSDANRRAVRSVGTMLDITERKRTEIELRTSQQRLELGTSVGELALVEVDFTSERSHLSREAAKLFGFGDEACVVPRATLHAIIHPDDRPAIMQHIANSQKPDGDGGFASDHRIIRPGDSSEAWLRVRYRVFFDDEAESRRPVRAMLAAIDVTAERQAQEAVRQSEARIQQALRASRSFTFEWEPETDAVRRSVSCADILQLTGDDAVNDVGQRFFQRVVEHDRTAFIDVVSKLTPTASSYTIEYRVRVNDGREVILEETGQGSFDASGNLVRLVGVTTDVTARKQAEAALKESDRRKDEFLATLSHELRNPLATIRSGLEVFRLTPDNPKLVAETRDLMQRQVTHLVALVDDLLEVSRISRGKLKLRREVVDIARAVEAAIEACQPLLHEACHELHVELPRHAVHVAGDPHRITQMFSNLLNNATKYTPTGGHISISATVNDSDVSISVRDTGVGISREELPRIFELFAQVKNESSAYAGLGIGLSLVKSLAEMHGGSVSAISDGKDKGSMFIVRLPICLLTQPSCPPTTVVTEPSATPSRRVLVVDDNVGAARTLSIVVKTLGNEVCTAHNGQDALEKGQEFLPEIIIMDIGMPVMDGYAAARAIRSLPWGKNTFLIALTGWGQEDDKQRTRDAGFDRHLVKPVEPSVIRGILAELSPALDGASPERRRLKDIVSET